MRETLLIVENDQLNAEMLRRRLERLSYTVFEIDDGLAVEPFLQQVQPDLILMDLGLRGIDGWTLTSRLKQNPDTCEIPVIAVTAHAMVNDRAKALKAGCDDYVTKPIDFLLLLAAIERQLIRTACRARGHAH